MPIAWYIIPYVELPGFPGRRARHVQINEDSGVTRWSEVELPGNRALVKVNAPGAVLTTLNVKYKRIPRDLIDDPLSSLSNAQKTALRNELQSMGYTLQQIQNRFPNDLGTYTLRDVLRFMSSKRFKCRADGHGGFTMATDLPEIPVNPDAELNAADNDVR